MAPHFFLFLILAVSFLIKIPALSLPLTGYFGSYQVMNAMMASMMSWNSWSGILIPRSFSIINGEPSLHLLHYPFASLAAFALNSLLGGEMGFWGHFQAAVSMLAAAFLLYLIVRKIFDAETGILAAFIFSFSPMILRMGSSFQNESLALLFLLFSFFLLVKNTAGWGGFLSGVIFSLALAARPHFLACWPAFLLFLISEKRSWKQMFFFCLGSVIPVSAWFGFVYYLNQNYPGIKTSLYSQLGEGRILIHPVLKTREFYERIFEILTGEWLTAMGIPFLVIGMMAWSRKQILFLFWLISALATIIILPQKVNDHPFYLIHSVPAAAVLIALALRSIGPSLSRGARVGLIVIFLLFSTRYYLPASIFSRSDGWEIQRIGREVQSLTKKEDKIIAAYGTSAELLYYCDRYGWSFDIQMAKHPFTDRQLRHVEKESLGYGDPVKWLEYLRSQGASYFVIAEPAIFDRESEFSLYVRSQYAEIPTSGNQFKIFDLTDSN